VPFYKSVFGGEFEGDGISRFGDIPVQEDAPQLSPEDKKLVMHVTLPILGGTKLMGSDAPEFMNPGLVMGNNVFISLHPDTRGETEQLFTALSTGGKVVMPLSEMFWGDYYGICVDQFGVSWMFICDSKV
jgi:PhnB protein